MHAQDEGAAKKLFGTRKFMKAGDNNCESW